MATISTFTNKVNKANPQGGVGTVVYKAENYLDFSTATGTNVAQNDVVKAIIIPAGSIVLDVGVVTLTVEGADDLIKVGDSAAADTFVADIDPTVASNHAIAAITTRKYYASADYIALKPTAGALTAYKCYVYCTFIKVEEVA